MTSGNPGVPKSPEHRQKLTEINRAKAKDPEFRKKLSVAGKGRPSHMKGKTRPPFSEETRRKMSDAAKKRCSSPEWIENMRKTRTGVKPSEETKLKLSISQKKRWETPGERDKRSEMFKRMWANPEIRKKASVSHTGKTLGEEHRKNVAAANRRKAKDPIICKKISIKTKGRIVLESTKEKMRGEKNPAWNGGSSFEPYCIKFNFEFRERVRAFFKYTCQICGHVWVIGEKRLAVHHVTYKKDACCNNNVIPLFVPVCSSKCHSRTNHYQTFWEDWFTEIINEFYNGKCYFTKEEWQDRQSL